MAQRDKALAMAMLGETVHFRFPGDFQRCEGVVTGYDPHPYRRPEGHYLIVRMEHDVWGWQFKPVPFHAVEEFDPCAPSCSPVDLSAWTKG